MAIACNTIMLNVCDELSHTNLYRHDRKRRINALTKDLEGFSAEFYRGLGEDAEQQYYTLVRVVEAAARLIADTPVGEVARLATFLDAWQKGQFAEVEEEGLQGMLRCGMLKLAAT